MIVQVTNCINYNINAFDLRLGKQTSARTQRLIVGVVVIVRCSFLPTQAHVVAAGCLVSTNISSLHLHRLDFSFPFTSLSSFIRISPPTVAPPSHRPTSIRGCASRSTNNNHATSIVVLPPSLPSSDRLLHHLRISICRSPPSDTLFSRAFTHVANKNRQFAHDKLSRLIICHFPSARSRPFSTHE